MQSAETQSVRFMLCYQSHRLPPQRQKNPLGTKLTFLYKIHRSVKTIKPSGKPRKAQMSCYRALQEPRKKAKLSDNFNYISAFWVPAQPFILTRQLLKVCTHTCMQTHTKRPTGPGILNGFQGKSFLLCGQQSPPPAPSH